MDNGLIKCVLFDLDGVLLDARQWHFDALNTALAHFGMNISELDHLERFDGLPTKTKLEMLNERFAIPANVCSMISRLKQKYTLDLIQAGTRPIWDQQLLVSRLARNNFRVGVVSNSVKSTIDLALERLQLTDFIEFIVSNEMVRTPKPDPEGYASAMRHFQVKPCETIVFEDNDNGINAARKSGANVLVVEDPSQVSMQVLGDFCDIKGLVLPW